MTDDPSRSEGSLPKTVKAQDFKKLASGIAAAILVCMLSFTVPVLGIFFFLLIPLPLILYRIRLGRKQGLIIAGAAFLLLAAIGNAGIDLVFLAAMMVLGVCMGEFIDQQRSVEQIIGISCGVVATAGMMGLVIYSNMINTGPVQLISGYIQTNLGMTIAFYEEIGISAETVGMLKAAREQIQYVLLRIIPGLIVASLLFSAWLNLVLARKFIRTGRMVPNEPAALNAWKTPDPLVWAVIACGLLLLIPDAALKLIGLNGMIILLTIYFFQGIAVVAYYFDRKRVPVVFRFFFYLFIALQQIFMIVIIGIGFFDVWGDFRRIGSADHQDGNETKPT